MDIHEETYPITAAELEAIELQIDNLRTALHSGSKDDALSSVLSIEEVCLKVEGRRNAAKSDQTLQEEAQHLVNEIYALAETEEERAEVTKDLDAMLEKMLSQHLPSQ